MSLFRPPPMWRGYQTPAGGLYTPANSLGLSTWSATRATRQPNSGRSPGRQLDAVGIIEDATASSTHTLDATFSLTSAAQPYTFTFFAKRLVGTRNVYLEIFNSAFTGSVHVGVDLGDRSINVAAAAVGTITSPSAVVAPYRNNWAQVALTFTGTIGTFFQFILSVTQGAGTTSYSGDGQSTIAVWGIDFR